MIVENRRAIDKFVAKHANSRIPIAEWLQNIEAAQWNNVVDPKRSFNSAAYVKGLVVFNVGSNNFRVVAEVVYTEQIVRIAKVGTDAEYDGWKL